ncbi:MAG TPA: dipeptide ABC transporter ATP-binding protein [Acidobacteriota bacterium]|nr:dipeptide ABC transporter ATP-binding protein [Acidobacteriota bacterium]
MSMTLLEVKNLTKHYSVSRGIFSRKQHVVKAVDGVSFSLNAGDTFGLVGESGCGKTTAGRCILRLIETTVGEIWFDGKDLLSLDNQELRKTRRNMQMIFQDPYASLNPRMTIRRILEEPLLIHRIGNKKERSDRVAELLRMVGLDPALMNRYPHEFSGGQRQRIGIARALALQPKLVVADEPVSALDVSVQAQIINLLKDLQQKLNLAFIFIAHDLGIVQYFCDRIAVMYLGKIVELASSKELFSNPLHPYSKLLLASIPAPDPRIRKKRENLKGELPTPINPPSGCYFHPRCPVAIDRCKTEEPSLREITPGHFAACHVVESTHVD